MFRFFFKDCNNFFQGKTPSEKERLNRSDTWLKILLLSNFKIFVTAISRPTAFKGSRDKIF